MDCCSRSRQINTLPHYFALPSDLPVSPHSVIFQITWSVVWSMKYQNRVKKQKQNPNITSPLLSLMVGGANVGITWGHRTLCTNKNDKGAMSPALAGAIQLTGEWWRCQSKTVLRKHLCQSTVGVQDQRWCHQTAFVWPTHDSKSSQFRSRN